MAKSRKRRAGEGWSLIPADGTDGEAAPARSLPPAEQRIRVRTERRPKGKTATVASGFVLTAADRKALAKTLKQATGGGGTDADDRIEVQGDHADAVRERLRALGYRTD